MLVTTHCQFCQKEFQARDTDLKRNQAKFCSRTCFGKNQSAQPKIEHEPNVTCAYCQKDFYMKPSSHKNSKSGLFFCCREHKDKAQRIGGIEAIQPDHYGDGKHTKYRRLALTELPNKCNHCSWDLYKEVLVVHHKDRDRTNNTIENLEVLCPTCHGVEHFKAGDGLYTHHH
jgi:hypothetical protein